MNDEQQQPSHPAASFNFFKSFLLLPFAVVGNNWCIISFPENVALGHRTHKSHSLSLQECVVIQFVVSQQRECVCVRALFSFLIIIISYKRGDSSISYKGAIINGAMLCF